MTMDEREEEIVRAFEALDDRMDEYKHLIEVARGSPSLADEHKTDETRIHGCQAHVWMRGTMEDGRAYFEADSPSLIVKGLATLLIRVLSGQRPDTILACELTFIEQVGLDRHLSPTRSNGLFSMLERMRSFARAHLQEDPTAAEPTGDGAGGCP